MMSVYEDLTESASYRLFEQLKDFLGILHEDPATEPEYNWKLVPTQPSYTSATTCTVSASDVRGFVSAGTLCRFKSPTTDPYGYGKVTSVSFSTDSVITFPTNTLDTSLAEFYVHRVDWLLLELLHRAMEFVFTSIWQETVVLAGGSIIDWIFGSGTQTLILDRFPITSVTTISLNGNTLDSDHYEAQASSGLVFRKKGRWTEGELFKATYTVSAFTLPNDVRHAFIELAAYFYKRSAEGLDPIGKKSDAEGGANYHYQLELPTITREVIEKYGRRKRGEAGSNYAVPSITGMGQTGI